MDKRMPEMIVTLERVLSQQLSLHSELLNLLKRKREVLCASDAKATIDLCALENEKLQKVAELEKRRLNLVADLTLMVEPGAAQPMCLTDLAQRLAEPARGRLLVLRQQLREKMLGVQEETSIVRRATETLAKHMQGIVQTIGAISAGVSTYGQRGAFPQRHAAVSTFSATA